jgi:tetratricopeptide (TPR) repeat protein
MTSKRNQTFIAYSISFLTVALLLATCPNLFAQETNPVPTKDLLADPPTDASKPEDTKPAEDAKPADSTEPAEEPSGEEKPESTEPATESTPADPNNLGQAELDAAIELQIDAAGKLGALQQVIDKAKAAIDKGLDEGNLSFAKELIGACAFQRAELLRDQIPQTNAPTGRKRLIGEMEKALKTALEYDPKASAAHELMAVVHVFNNRRDEAMDSISKAIELTDDRTKKSELYFGRAQIAIDPEEQMADLEKATEVNPYNGAAWILRSRLLEANGRNDEAVEVLEQCLANEPEDRIVAEAINDLLNLDRATLAIPILNGRIEKSPEVNAFWRMRGVAKMRTDDLPGAIEDFTEAIKLNDKDSMSLMFRAQSYAGLKPEKLDEAEADIEKAIELDSNNLGAIHLRALIFSMQNKHDEAIADFQFLIKNNPDNIQLLLQLASSYQQDKRSNLALATYDLILKNDEDNMDALRSRGDAYLDIGKQQEAIADYEKLFRLMPDENIDEKSGLLNNLAWVLSTSPKDEIRDGKRALELALEACELTSYGESHILSTLAAAYAETGDFEKAKEWSGKAVEKAKSDVETGAKSAEESQIEQLQEELKGYQDNKPFRELKESEEVEQPNIQIEDAVDA